MLSKDRCFAWMVIFDWYSKTKKLNFAICSSDSWSWIWLESSYFSALCKFHVSFSAIFCLLHLCHLPFPSTSYGEIWPQDLWVWGLVGFAARIGVGDNPLNFEIVFGGSRKSRTSVDIFSKIEWEQFRTLGNAAGAAGLAGWGNAQCTMHSAWQINRWKFKMIKSDGKLEKDTRYQNKWQGCASPSSSDKLDQVSLAPA